MKSLIMLATRLGAPHRRQEQERHEHQVEEDHEEREVLGHERAQHAALGQPEPQEEQVRALPLAQRRPRIAGENSSAASAMRKRFRPSTPSL
jgi:hypothetical protein